MKHKFFWGLAFVLLAVLIFLNSIFLDFDIPVLRLFLGVACFVWLIKIISRCHFPFVFFPIAFIFMLFEKYIAGWLGNSENIISNWIVLLCALLLCIGTGFMFSGFDFHNVNVVSFNGRNRLTSIVKYIDCTDFVNDSVEVNMGRGEVFFENTDGYAGEGTLYVENNMSRLTINIPSSLKVICHIESNMGHTDIHVNNNSDGKTLYITGENNMGHTNIKSV